MASLITRLSAAFTAVKTETKALRTMISGTNNGNVSGLETTATNIVGAINELNDALDGAGAVIDDGAADTDTDTVYSSSKVMTEINTAKTAVKNEILGGAAAEVDTLVEIANLLATNTSTDAALAAVVANKANSSDVYTQAEIGNPDTDLVAVWNAA